MRKTRKALLAVACAAVLVAGSVAATLAYLTDKDEVRNTFTVGNVAIKLDEAKTSDNGDGSLVYVEKEGSDENELAARVKSNTYKLIPGHKYTKDPTLTVLSGSEESYVRLMVTVTFDGELPDGYRQLDLDDIFTGFTAPGAAGEGSPGWVKSSGPSFSSKTKSVNGSEVSYTVVTYEYRYSDTVRGEVSGAAADNKLPALFTGFTVPSDWTNEDLQAIGGFDIDVQGQAIQADGFSTADAAWAAFGTQVTGATLPPSGGGQAGGSSGEGE